MARRLRARILLALQNAHTGIQVYRETGDKDIFSLWKERLLSHISVKRLVANRRTHVPPPNGSETLDDSGLRAPPGRLEAWERPRLANTARLRGVLEDSIYLESYRAERFHSLHIRQSYGSPVFCPHPRDTDACGTRRGCKGGIRRRNSRHIREQANPSPCQKRHHCLDESGLSRVFRVAD